MDTDANTGFSPVFSWMTHGSVASDRQRTRPPLPKSPAVKVHEARGCAGGPGSGGMERDAAQPLVSITTAIAVNTALFMSVLPVTNLCNNRGRLTPSAHSARRQAAESL